jgi:outer membrane protein OmpA-like peptidoglycan-associated protein
MNSRKKTTMPRTQLSMFRSHVDARAKTGLLTALVLGSASAIGCAGGVPKELNDARDAYRGAAAGPAVQHSPAQLHTAEKSLQLAETTFEEEGGSDLTKDRAYVAMRKAQLADTQARLSQANLSLESMEKQSETAQVAELKEAKGALQTSEQARKEAEARAAAAALELARLASVKQEPRGMVITLSGSVLFASDKAELLPAAQQRLAEVAKALNDGNREAQIVVEGHTDAKGGESYNLELSARRAQAVRSYLVSQGIGQERIRSEGLGFSRPIADNKSAEGRANNRRVEIVVQPSGDARSSRVGT